jgi:hypothetical protein
MKGGCYYVWLIRDYYIHVAWNNGISKYYLWLWRMVKGTQM